MVAHIARWHVRCFECLQRELEDVVMTKLIALLLLASTAACGELTFAPASEAGGQRSNDPPGASAPSEPSPIQPAPGPQVGQQDPQAPAPSSACPGAAGCDRLVFLSSTTYSASYFRSALAADDKCNALAKASSNPDIQKRTFAAWMSDATTSPKARFVRSDTPYTMPNGQKIADDYADLTSDTGIYTSLDVDENGKHHDGGSAWTGTRPDGSATQANCTNWQLTSGLGTKGDITSNGSDWSAAGRYGDNTISQTIGSGSGDNTSWNSCQSSSAHIYCFEQ